MICSKCKFKLREEDSICPKCGKLVKEECPRCSTHTLAKICPKCNLNLVKKCPKCSQSNHIIQDVCIRCKTSLKTYEQLTLFASVSLEIQNLSVIPKKDEVKKILQGIGIYLKDDAKEKHIGFKHLKKNIFVLKFYNANTLKESCVGAINYAYEMIKFLESLNDSIYRRYRRKLKIRVGLSLSNKFDRRNFSRTEQAININEEIYIIGNSYIVKYINDAKVEHLISLPESNRINKIYKIVPQEIEQQEVGEVAASILYELDEEKEPKIKLALEHYTQENIGQAAFEHKFFNILQAENQYHFINIETSKKENKHPFFNLHRLPLELRKVDFCKLRCSLNDSYKPFSFIRNIIASFYHCSLINSQEVDILQAMSLNELYRIMNFQLDTQTNLDEMKFRIWDEFKSFLSKISLNHNVVFIVENFELVDNSSLECLNDLIETDSVYENIRFVFFTENSYDFFNNDMPVLLGKEYFLNISLKKSPYKDIAKVIKNLGINLKTNNLFQKIFKNSKGSYSYVMNSIKYLEAINAIDVIDDKVYVIDDNVATLPFTNDEIVEKRLEVLSNKKELYLYLAKLVLLSDSFDLEVLKSKLSVDSAGYVKKLIKLGFITEFISSGIIFINDYNVIYEYFCRYLNEKELALIKQDIVSKLKISPESLLVNSIFLPVSNSKLASKTLYDLAYASIELGDIHSACKCFEKFIEFVSQMANNKEEFNKFKNDIYKTIIMFSIDSHYDLACEYIQKALRIVSDHKTILNYYFLLVQASFCAEKYKLTKEYIAKILNIADLEVFDSYSEKFDINFYNLKLIEAKVLYYTGETKKALEQLDEVLQTLLSLRKTQSYNNEKKFKAILDNSIAESLAFKALCALYQNENTLHNTIKYIKQESSQVFSPELLKTVFEVYKNLSMKAFDDLESFILKSKGSMLEKNIAVMVYLLACIQMDYFDKALVIAFKFKKQRLYSKQVKLMFELVIICHHIKIGLYYRAKELLDEVIKQAKENQFNKVLFVSWIVLARLLEKQGNAKEAYELLSQSNVVVEENHNIPKIFSVIFKRELSLIMLKLSLNSETLGPLQIAFNQADACEYSYFKVDLAVLIIDVLQKELHSQEDPIHRSNIEIELQNIFAIVKKEIENTQNPNIQQKFVRLLQGRRS